MIWELKFPTRGRRKKVYGISEVINLFLYLSKQTSKQLRNTAPINVLKGYTVNKTSGYETE